MAWILYVAPSGVGGELPPTVRRNLEVFLPTLSTFITCNQERGEYTFVDPTWSAVMRFTPQGLELWWDDYTDGWVADLVSLAAYARGNNLGLFKAPGVPFDWDQFLRILIDPD